jgi:hypothetical protein
MLLPAAFARGGSPDLLLAVTEPPLRILGAAAGAPATDRDRPALRVSLRVVSPYRCRGIGSRLLEGLLALARARRAGALIATHDPAEGPEGPRFLRGRGFERRDQLLTFDVDLRTLGFLRRAQDRLAARGRIPPHARVVPLSEGMLEPVARLQVEHLGGIPEAVRGQLRRSLRGGPSIDTSVVLLEGDAVRGHLLAEVEGRQGVVTSCVVAPGYRGGWANVLLKVAAVGRLLDCGADRVRFACSPLIRDTLKLAERSGAGAVQALDVYALDLVTGPQTSASALA